MCGPAISSISFRTSRFWRETRELSAYLAALYDTA